MIWKGKNGPLLIAEIGGNHEGSFQYAKKLCQLAINTNVDCIKFQLYKANDLVTTSCKGNLREFSLINLIIPRA